MQTIFYYIIGVLWTISPMFFYNLWRRERTVRKYLQTDLKSTKEIINQYLKNNEILKN